MTKGKKAKFGPAKDQASKDYTESTDSSRASTPIDVVHGDYVPEHESLGHEDVVELGNDDGVGHDDTINHQEPINTAGAVEMDERPSPDTSMAVDDVAGDNTAGDPEPSEPPAEVILSSNESLNNEATDDTSPQSTGTTTPPDDEPAAPFRNFMHLPTELRWMIWGHAMQEEGFRLRSPLNPGCVQRFRFGLRYDPARVRPGPGRDALRGWVACFTPLKINTRPYHKFLRASRDSRDYMMNSPKNKMSMLTVHALRYDAAGRTLPGPPRKCHVPFNFGRDVFCVEGITQAVRVARRVPRAVWRRMRDKARVLALRPLAETLDVALGLRFAWRIKRLAIIPNHGDLEEWKEAQLRYEPWTEQPRGAATAALAMRFPSLVHVRSGIPMVSRPRRREDDDRRFLRWYGSDLRGIRQVTGLERNAVFQMAWWRIFDRGLAHAYWYTKPEFWGGGVCLVWKTMKRDWGMVDL